MIVPRIINMISHMDTCQLKWKNLLEGKRNQAIAVTEENISDEIYNKALYDFVGITAGAQLYFALGSMKRNERPTVNKSLLG